MAFQQLWEKRNTYIDNREWNQVSICREKHSVAPKYFPSYEYLEHKWTYHCINKLQSFVGTVNSRTNRVTQLDPNKVTRKHVPHLRALAVENSKNCQTTTFLSQRWSTHRKRRFTIRERLQAKLYNWIFSIKAVPTSNPPAYNLQDNTGGKIQGNFCELELVNTNGRVWHLSGINRFFESLSQQHTWRFFTIC